jgi:tetratricopeptide (TPR) repeat protein
MNPMRGLVELMLCAVVLGATLFAQQPGSAQGAPGPNEPLPRSTPAPRTSGESSSRDTIIDLSPPPDDAKDHPDSAADSDEDDNNSDVKEFHPYDPHKAEKDVEVGDFYFKRCNYRAAADRYREALDYKPNDATATFGLATALERQGNKRDAVTNYASYLKILPNGPRADEARRAVERLKGNVTAQAKSAETKK